MKAKDLIEGFKKKEYGWEEETQTYRHADTMRFAQNSPWKEGEITLYAYDIGGYDVTDELRVEFRDGTIELIWDDKTYNCDYDLIKKVTHRVKLVESEDSTEADDILKAALEASE